MLSEKPKKIIATPQRMAAIVTNKPCLWIFFVHKKNLQEVGHLLEVKADFLVIDVTPEQMPHCFGLNTR